MDLFATRPGRDHHNEAVIDLLTMKLEAIDFENTEIYIVQGSPKSDIGKGELIARLAFLAPDTKSIVKFDAILNTNVNGQHPSLNDDFGTYRKFLPNIGLGWPHQLLGGEILQEFIEDYGGSNDHLTFSPYLAQYFLLKLHKCWVKIGKPEHLFLEIGGTCRDPEVAAFALPAISLLGNLHSKTKFFMLIDAGFDHASVKTKIIQNALREGVEAGLRYDSLFIRKPPAFAESIGDSEIYQQVEKKIKQSLIYAGACPNLFLIPHFSAVNLDGYTDYLASFRNQLFGPKADAWRLSARKRQSSS